MVELEFGDVEFLVFIGIGELNMISWNITICLCVKANDMMDAQFLF